MRDDETDQDVADERAAEGDVVEAVAVVDDVAHPVRRVAVDAGDRREASELRHGAEEEVQDHAERQRQHQEVDAVAARGDGAEHERDNAR